MEGKVTLGGQGPWGTLCIWLKDLLSDIASPEVYSLPCFSKMARKAAKAAAPTPKKAMNAMKAKDKPAEAAKKAMKRMKTKTKETPLVVISESPGVDEINEIMASNEGNVGQVMQRLLKWMAEKHMYGPQCALSNEVRAWVTQQLLYELAEEGLAIRKVKNWSA